MNLKQIYLLLCVIGYASISYAQKDSIRVNQVGYYPKGPKMAIIIGSNADKFSIMDTAMKQSYFDGTLQEGGLWKYSEEKTKKADFSNFTKEGTYVVVVPGSGKSYPFEIKNQVHLDPAKASIKALYYNRASMEILPEYGGKFPRASGHPDTEVYVHSSAATSTRPEGTVISSPRGWYDAGDYNKYIVNSGISTYTLLSIYEHFPKYMDTLQWNIPESKNTTPDILDEVLWNLRWMLTMQDTDGGVYHKLTNPSFDPMVMPEMAKEKRYVVMKSTAAALDFAAVTAAASRIFAKFPKEYPGLADSCLKAAKAAYKWAEKNPNVLYAQNEMNKAYDPDVVTGEYGDGNVSDEFQWAALELFVTTGDKTYLDASNVMSTLNSFNLPGWPTVNTLGLYSLIQNKNKFNSVEGLDISKVEDRIIQIADSYVAYAQSSPYGAPMGVNEDDFVWGSNSTTANQGILLIQAYRITKNEKYLNAAIANLDYLLGRNATGYSFLTGYGDRSTMNIHHRPSVADRIKNPIPGFLSGGPNPGQQDDPHCKPYPSKLPAKSYLDHSCSYASNEIAINWNAPFSYLSIAIEEIKATGSKPAASSEKKKKDKKKK